MLYYKAHKLKRVFLSGLCLYCALLSSAQGIEYANEIIAALGSDKMNGRGYAGRGDTRAAAYIRREFIQNGLDPVAADYYQPFKIDVNTFPSRMELELNGTRLISGSDFTTGPSSPGIKGSFGIAVIETADLLQNDSLCFSLDLKDRFLVIDNSQSDGMDAKEKDILEKKIAMIRENPAITAAGILELVKDHPGWGIASHVSLKPWFRVSHPIDPDTLARLDVKVVSRFRQDYNTRNVMGYFTGTEYPDSFIVFTAHYDHIGMMGKGARFPGANDNASGVAMMLYLSRYFQSHPPPVSVIFIAFSAEELGLLGSSHFVSHSPIDLARIGFLVNLDMVGTGSNGIKVVNGTLYKEEFDLLSDINERYRFLSSVTARSPSCISDHCPFDYQDVPGFYIYTEGESPAYHSIHDRLEELSLAGFEGLAKLLILFVEAL